MPGQICTYTSYLTDSIGYFGRNFWKNSDGHSALLTITDVSLSAADYALSYSNQSHDHVHQAANRVRELKLIHSIMQIPSSFFSLQRRFYSLRTDCLSIHRKQKQKGETLHIELVAIGSAKLIYSTISLAGLAFYKPLKMLRGQHFFSDLNFNKIMKSWEYLSFIKSASKMGYLAGKIATSSEKIIHRTINLSLEISEGIISSLQLNRVRIHPAIYGSFSFAKGMFTLYRLWTKTV